MNNKFVVLATVLCLTLCRSCCVSAVGQPLQPVEKASVRWVEDLETKIAELELRIADLESRIDKLEPKPTPAATKEFDGLGKMPLPDLPAGQSWRFVPKSQWSSLPIGTKNQDGCTWDGVRWVCPLRKGK